MPAMSISMIITSASFGVNPRLKSSSRILMLSSESAGRFCIFSIVRLIYFVAILFQWKSRFNKIYIYRKYFNDYSVKKSWAPYSFFNFGVLKYFQRGIPNSSSGRTDNEVFAASIIFWASESGVIFGLRQPSLVSRATTATAERFKNICINSSISPMKERERGVSLNEARNLCN